MNYPHRTASTLDPSDADVPDPQFGTLDAQILATMLGEPALQAARWASFAQEQQKTIAALREQVAALKAKLRPVVAAPEKDAAKEPVMVGKNGPRA